MNSSPPLKNMIAKPTQVMGSRDCASAAGASRRNATFSNRRSTMAIAPASAIVPRM